MMSATYGRLTSCWACEHETEARRPAISQFPFVIRAETPGVRETSVLAVHLRPISRPTSDTFRYPHEKPAA